MTLEGGGGVLPKWLRERLLVIYSNRSGKLDSNLIEVAREVGVPLMLAMGVADQVRGVVAHLRILSRLARSGGQPLGGIPEINEGATSKMTKQYSSVWEIITKQMEDLKNRVEMCRNKTDKANDCNVKLILANGILQTIDALRAYCEDDERQLTHIRTDLFEERGFVRWENLFEGVYEFLKKLDKDWGGGNVDRIINRLEALRQELAGKKKEKIQKFLMGDLGVGARIHWEFALQKAYERCYKECRRDYYDGEGMVKKLLLRLKNYIADVASIQDKLNDNELDRIIGDILSRYLEIASLNWTKKS